MITCGSPLLLREFLKHLQVDIQPLLGEIHRLKQLLVLTGGLHRLLLRHRAQLFPVLISDRLEPVKRVELQVLVQQLQDVRNT